MAEQFAKVKDFIKSLSNRKKWLSLGSLFVVVIVIAIMFLTKPELVPLVSNVEYDKMAIIVEKLDEMNLKHEEVDGANTILVEKNDLTKAKMAIAVELNMSIPDYTWTEFFASTSFTMTADIKEQQIMLAKASKLREGLLYIDGVEDARVDLYLGQDTNFLLDESEESSVSLMLTLKDGVNLSSEQVSGIVNYIMNAVQSLPKENITIIDQTGMTLNKFSEDTDAFMASTQFEQTTIVENQLEAKLNSFLANLYGRTRVKVAASIILNFDGYNETSTLYTPPVSGETEGMVLSMSTISKSVVDSDTASGVPGTESNIDVTDYPTSSNGSSGYEEKSEMINYQINEIVSVLNKAKGTIKDISISVIIDTEALEENVLTEEHKKEVINLVTNAAGVETRSVEVMAFKFADTDAGIRKITSDDMLEEPGIPMWLLGVIIGVLALVVIAFFLITKAKNKKQKADEIEKARADENEKVKSELEEIQTDQVDASSPKYQIEKFVDAKPDLVANLLRSWMNEM